MVCVVRFDRMALWGTGRLRAQHHVLVPAPRCAGVHGAATTLPRGSRCTGYASCIACAGGASSGSPAISTRAALVPSSINELLLRAPVPM